VRQCVASGRPAWCGDAEPGAPLGLREMITMAQTLDGVMFVLRKPAVVV
jgi:hypothetical protein